MSMNKKRVAIVFGGQSAEHEVSRVSAEEVVKNIDRDKYDVIMIGVTRLGKWLRYDGPETLLSGGQWQEIAETRLMNQAAKLPEISENSARQLLRGAGAENGEKRIDVVFPLIHGCNGEDGTLQGLLELAGVPYVGCGVLSSALGMDKGFAKIVFEKEGIPQGTYMVVTRSELGEKKNGIICKAENMFGYPCFVKPCNSGSSVGVTKAHDRDELEKGLGVAAEYDRRILVEEFIDGREVECAVLGNDNPVASVVGEVIPGNEFYDYAAKYSSDSKSKTIIPASLPEEVANTVREYSIRAFKALDCSGLARADFFVRRSGEVLINEINTMPGFTRISMYSKLWEATGVPYPDLIDKLIQLALQRHEQNRRRIDINGS